MTIRAPAIAVLLLLLSAPGAAGAVEGERGIGVGAEARGVAESETPDGGARQTRAYDIARPWIEAIYPSPGLRIELKYEPLFFFPMRGIGDKAFAQNDRVTIRHVGHLELRSLPARGLTALLRDDLQASPVRFIEPLDAPDRLRQTNEAKAHVTLERGRRGGIALSAEARRFDVFVRDSTEYDSNGDGVLDPQEDLNGNGIRDPGALRSSFSEGTGEAGLWRQLSRSNRAGVFGIASTRAYDEISNDDFVSAGGGFEAKRQVQEKLSAVLRLVATSYRFQSGASLTGYAATGTGSWLATRNGVAGVRVAAQRSIDTYGQQTDLDEGILNFRRDAPRGVNFGTEVRVARNRSVRGLDKSYDGVSGAVGGDASVPIRWGVRVKGGIRFWRGGGPALKWTTNQLVFLGLVWE